MFSLNYLNICTYVHVIEFLLFRIILEYSNKYHINIKIDFWPKRTFVMLPLDYKVNFIGIS